MIDIQPPSHPSPQPPSTDLAASTLTKILQGGESIAWIDANAGVAGDMLCAAMVDLGVPLQVMQDAIDDLDLGIELVLSEVSRASLSAKHLNVKAPETDHARHLSDIIELFERLDPAIAKRAISVFEILGAAEAKAHNVSIEEVHFHEVGALDSIADIVAVCAAMQYLDLASLYCSLLSLGSGMTHGAHGPIPIPAPAVSTVCAAHSIPCQAGPAPFESTTPTGASLIAEFVDGFSPMPAMVIDAIGHGAGSRECAEVANMVRIFLGRPLNTTADHTHASHHAAQSGAHDHDHEAALNPTTSSQAPTSNAYLNSSYISASYLSGPAAPLGFINQHLTVLETNIDDGDPRLLPDLVSKALALGALDAWITPIVMKKGRSAHKFSILCDPSLQPTLLEAIFSHTSSIGVRCQTLQRVSLERELHSVQISGQQIAVKTAKLPNGFANISFEWEDVQTAASQIGVAPKEVIRRASAAFDAIA